MAKESISFRVDSEKKNNLYKICENHKINVADILRNYIDLVLKTKSTNIEVVNTVSDNKNEDFKFILQEMKDSNNSIIKILKTQLEEKDKQLDQKNKLIENMQVLMKDNQQLLKEEQSKNVLLLENKNNTNKTSWFPFFKNKNV